MKTLSIIFLLTVSFGYKSYTQQSANSFLGIRLGQSESSFIQSYPNATSNSDELLSLYSNIEYENMKIYSIQKVTSSGDEVKIDCYFKNQKLAVMRIEYAHQFDNSILKGLAAKYGHYSKSKIYTYTDPLNNLERTEVVITWLQFKTSILEYDNTEELGYPHIIFADKNVQLNIAKRNQKANVSKIE